MDNAKKLELLADVMDLEVKELKPELSLESLGWDSVARLTFIVMMSDEFKRSVAGEEVRALVTVQDALNMMTVEQGK